MADDKAKQADDERAAAREQARQEKALAEKPAAVRARAEVAAEAGDAPPAEGEVTKYTVERLIAESEAFTGHPSHVAAGALFGIRGAISVEEAKSLCDRWLKTEVQSA